MTNNETMTFRCPSCGADMKFDAELGKMKCDFCDTVADVDEFENENEKAVEEDVVEGEFEVDDEEILLHKYKCSSCGAEILADDNTAATFCNFCGMPAMIEERLQGEKKPAFVIPFKIKKDSAVETYTSWAKKGVMTPSKFYAKATIDKITGIYVPFWLYDYHARMHLTAHGTRTRSETRGSYRYTHTDHYHIVRDIETDYVKIPADASEKMPDDVMDKLEPFNYADLTDFEMPYLSGYYAEKYNYSADDMAPRLEHRVKNYINSEVMNTIAGYGGLRVTERRMNVKKLRAKYALLPVWILNCTYNGKNFMFAMNGQTGRVVADKPISAGKVMGWFAGLTASISIVLYIIGMFL